VRIAGPCAPYRIRSPGACKMANYCSAKDLGLLLFDEVVGTLLKEDVMQRAGSLCIVERQVTWPCHSSKSWDLG
jgi:hypothetical protein